MIAGYIGAGDRFAEAVAKFGSLYADQTEKDWQALRRSGKSRTVRNRHSVRARSAEFTDSTARLQRRIVMNRRTFAQVLAAGALGAAAP